MPADTAPGDALRVALVGVGSAATGAHLPALRQVEARGLARLVGVCDRDRGRRDAALAGHPGAVGFADNEAMLDSIPADLLVIATPPSAHLGEIGAAAARGVDVLCEKPLGLADADLIVLQNLAAAHPRQLIATVHQYRYAQPWQWIARAVSGALRHGEEFDIHVVVERPGTDPLSSGDWRSDPDHEGGILGDHAVHYLALCEALDPACAVVSCHREGPGGREFASVELRLGRAGRAVVEVSYAGSRRANHVRLTRPAQCLEIDWRDARWLVTHDGRASAPRTVAALSDRAVVNGLYAPMYDELITRVADDEWRTRATAHTVDTAALLATAIRLGR